MIKINEQKLLLFSEIKRVSNWREEEIFLKVSQPMLSNCNLSMLELLETKSGQIAIMMWLHKLVS